MSGRELSGGSGLRISRLSLAPWRPLPSPSGLQFLPNPPPGDCSPQALQFFDSQGPPLMRPSVTITYAFNVVAGAEAGPAQDARPFGDDVYGEAVDTQGASPQGAGTDGCVPTTATLSASRRQGCGPHVYCSTRSLAMRCPRVPLSTLSCVQAS